MAQTYTVANIKQKRGTLNPYIVLIIAIFVGATAPPFVRLAQNSGAASPIIAMGRLAVATLALSPFVMIKYRDELRHIPLNTLLSALFAGCWLIIHFLLFIVALESSSILIVTVLLNASPLWVALLETFFLKTKLNRIIWGGLFIAIIGGLVIAGSSLNGSIATDNSSMIGNLLAVAGGIASAIYITTGRSARKSISIVPYAWLVFGTGTVIGLIVMLLMGVPRYRLSVCVEKDLRIKHI